MNKYSKCIDCIHAINEDCLGLRDVKRENYLF